MDERDRENFHKFISTTVHHLREPVRGVRVHAELVGSLADGLNDDTLTSIGFLERAAGQIQSLLEGLGELVTATDVARRSSVKLDLTVRQAKLHLKKEMAETLAEVAVEELPTVDADPDKIQLLFRHLLQNAIRYRSTSAPVVHISAREVDGETVVEIQDNGIGIAPNYHARIFEPYIRLHGKELPGNGLGLTVSKAIVEGHGGRMWVESAEGEGSRFLFSLPQQS